MEYSNRDRSNVKLHIRSKKRVFHGNRHSSEKKRDFKSTSAEKRLGGMNMNEPIGTSFVYCILDFAGVFFAIPANLICAKYKSDVTFP